MYTPTRQSEQKVWISVVTAPNATAMQTSPKLGDRARERTLERNCMWSWERRWHGMRPGRAKEEKSLTMSAMKSQRPRKHAMGNGVHCVVVQEKHSFTERKYAKPGGTTLGINSIRFVGR
jgi:hypothetical protein